MLHHDWFDFPAPNERAGMPVDAGMSLESLVKAFGAECIDATYEPLFDAKSRGGAPRDTELTLVFPEEWHKGVERYQATLAHLQETAPFSVLVTHGAGVGTHRSVGCHEHMPAHAKGTTWPHAHAPRGRRAWMPA